MSVLSMMSLLAACGGGTEEPGGATQQSTARGAESPSASAEVEAAADAESEQPRPPAKALSEAQLQAAVLVDTDLNGFQMSEEMGGMPAPEGVAQRVSPAKCQPLLNMAVGKLEPRAKAFRYSVAVSMPASGQTADQTGVEIKLFALDQAGAEQILAKLRTAATGCGGYDNGGHQAVAAADAPDSGDEAVSYRTTAQGSVPIWTTVVRSGATVMAFGHYAAEMPDEVLSAQVSKVEKVAAG
ncbi:hypothetical protein ACH4TV_23580 [Streptomyces sp. NPDC020898]|uniref:hypothetical protein n=1 Tax=Streptomyces sp. NPDC020898 TaxID=3365101 RepID=UPI0037B329A0